MSWQTVMLKKVQLLKTTMPCLVLQAIVRVILATVMMKSPMHCSERRTTKRCIGKQLMPKFVATRNGKKHLLQYGCTTNPLQPQLQLNCKRLKTELEQFSSCTLQLLRTR